jgi:tRNA pseudouridine55 synthase
MNIFPSVDGVLLIDKPTGPTSHDAVARIRRVLRQRSIGHTGTLDPLASGLLALVVGRATRLASVLAGSDKTYDATIRLGFATTTDDALGQPLPKRPGVEPQHPVSVSDEAVRRVLDGFRGTFNQTPPAHSAKKVGGVKAYDAARRDEPLVLAPVAVTVRTLDWTGRTEDILTLRVTATAGFYVRALARDIGATLGCGAHLTVLRRLRSGPFSVENALPLAEAERLDAAALGERLLPPSAALPQLRSVVLNDQGLLRVAHGNWVTPAHCQATQEMISAGEALVKLLAPEGGRLVALAKARSGALHPVVVLG